MAHGGVQRAPYSAVVALWRWFAAEWQWIDGHLTLRNIDLFDLYERLTADRFLNVLVAVLTDDHNGMVDRGQVRDALVHALEGTTSAAESAPTLETWGTSAEAQAGQEAMMRLIG